MGLRAIMNVQDCVSRSQLSLGLFELIIFYSYYFILIYDISKFIVLKFKVANVY